MLALLLWLEGVALTGGTVHTLVEGEAPRVATVLIKDGKIEAVGPDLQIPEGTEKIDVQGKHLIPGLIDGMVNHDPDHDRLYVSAGVTLVRDTGNDLAPIISERNPKARDRGPGPAILTAGAVLDGIHPSTSAAIVLGNPEEAAEKLARLFEYKVDFLSLHMGLDVATWRAVVELAHKQGLKVWGPVTPVVSLLDILGAKQDGLFHLDGFLPAGVGWDKAEPAMFAALVDAVAQSQLAITPALSVYAQRLVAQDGANEPELAYLGPFYHQLWLRELEVRRGMVNKEFLATGLRVHQQQSKLLKLLFDRGVKLVPGSASPNAWLFPGRALIDELKLWGRAGIPPAAVLRLATVKSAVELGVSAERGTLEAGKIADICVLAKDPEADLTALDRPDYVVLRGRVLDRATLDGLTQKLADDQKRLREQDAKPLTIAEPVLPPGEVLLRGSVESRAFGGRVSGETFAVVARPEGTLTYCGRMLTPGSASTRDTAVTISQTISDGAVTDFEIEIVAGKRTIGIRGIFSGGRLNIERRMDGRFVDTQPVKERLALVDVGSVTTELILGHDVRPGKFRVLFFDNFEPAIGNWELRLDADGTHLLRTHNGEMKIRYDPSGAPAQSLRGQGTGVSEMRPLSLRAEKGLPLPAEKRAGKKGQ